MFVVPDGIARWLVHLPLVILDPAESRPSTPASTPAPLSTSTPTPTPTCLPTLTPTPPNNEFGSLRVIDVADPAAPVEVGFHDTLGSAGDVAVADGCAYVADGPAGLHILRFTGEATATPTPTATR